MGAQQLANELKRLERREARSPLTTDVKPTDIEADLKLFKEDPDGYRFSLTVDGIQQRDIGSNRSTNDGQLLMCIDSVSTKARGRRLCTPCSITYLKSSLKNAQMEPGRTQHQNISSNLEERLARMVFLKWITKSNAVLRRSRSRKAHTKK